MTVDSSLETMHVRRQYSLLFERPKKNQKKTCQPKIPYPEKITFKDKDVSDKQNDPHTSTTRYAKEIS